MIHPVEFHDPVLLSLMEIERARVGNRERSAAIDGSDQSIVCVDNPILRGPGAAAQRHPGRW